MILAQVEHKDSAQDAHPYGTLEQPVAQLHAREHEPAKPSVLSGESGTRPGTCEEREHHGQVAIVLIVPAAIRAHETERLVSRRGREGNQYSASEELKGVQLVGLPVEDAGGVLDARIVGSLPLRLEQLLAEALCLMLRWQDNPAAPRAASQIVA